MIDAAIVGLGWWGKTIVKAVQGKSDRLRFTRGVSKEPDGVRDFAAQHDFQLLSELDAVLGDPRIQAVVLATPHSLHPQQVVASAKAGKPVFCEKPLALTRADALRAVRACREAGVTLGLGTNKRFWPSMRELRQVVASGALGRMLYIEGNSSNANSGQFFAPWRDLEAEAPGGGMTGPGLHMLDALVSLGGPLRRVTARLVTHKPAPDPLDAVTVLVDFVGGVSGVLSAVRATPFYWRVHVFGDEGSAEALGETELVLHRTGQASRRQSFTPVDSVRAELDVFADAVTGRSPYPLATAEMLDVVAGFEAIIASLGSGAPTAVARAH
jgi:predicted dehydrogenase